MDFFGLTFPVQLAIMMFYNHNNTSDLQNYYQKFMIYFKNSHFDYYQ